MHHTGMYQDQCIMHHAQGGPKGRRLEVGAQRAPKLLVPYILHVLSMLSQQKSWSQQWSPYTQTGRPITQSCGEYKL